MKTDKVLCIDLEATCGEGIPKDGSEIIEVGIAVINNNTLEIEKSSFILVKPEFTIITPFCTRLTTWTPEAVAKDGIPLKDACKILREEYHASEYVWYSWGMYDRNQMANECKRKGIEYPLSYVHFNLKNMFSLLHGFDRMYGQAGASERMRFQWSGTHHRGVDDSRNAAMLYIDMAKKVRELDKHDNI